jgi:drug/metabolite transporter (DMT)-like permease
MSTRSDAPPAQTGARAMTGTEWGLVALLSLLWGASFLFNGVALREVPVLSIVAFRVLVGAAALLVVLRISGVTLPTDRAALMAYAGMALLNNMLPFTLIVVGQTRIPSGLASILNAATPIFTMLLAHVFLASEKLDARRAVGVVLGFAGVVVLFSDRAFSGTGELLGLIACTAAALSYGFANIFGRTFIPKGSNPIALATGQLIVSSLVMVPLAFWWDKPFMHASPGREAMLALLGLALLSTAAAYALFFRILTRAGATNASLVTLIIPPSAIAMGAMILGERLGVQEFLGFAVIAAGLLVVDGRALRFLRAPSKGM